MNRIKGIRMIPSYGNLGRFEARDGENLPFYSDLVRSAFASSAGGDENVALLDIPCVSLTGFCRIRNADRTGAEQVYTRGQQKSIRPVRKPQKVIVSVSGPAWRMPHAARKISH